MFHKKQTMETIAALVWIKSIERQNFRSPANTYLFSPPTICILRELAIFCISLTLQWI